MHLCLQGSHEKHTNHCLVPSLDYGLIRHHACPLCLAWRQVRPPAPLSQKDMTIPVVIMIGREITMSALREWAAASGGAAHRAVKVNTLGKYKTALQARPQLLNSCCC